MMEDDPMSVLANSDPFSSWWPLVIAVVVGVITTIRSYFGGPSCPSPATIHGKTIVITGGSSGIGLEVVKELFARGGRLIVGSRNPADAEQAINREIKGAKDRILVKHLDLTSLKSVRKFAESLSNESKVDVLINNAGVAFQQFKISDEGFETHFVTNYLSHFLLTHLLLPKLKESTEARVINVSAQAHYAGHLCLDDLNLESDYSYNKAFGQSKLALVMMARRMAKNLHGTNVNINAMHPGLVRGTKQFEKSPLCTSFFVNLTIKPWAWLLMKTPKQGAQTVIYMAVATELSNTTGKYFSNCKEIDPSEKALDDVAAEKLYQKSLQLTGLSTK